MDHQVSLPFDQDPVYRILGITDPRKAINDFALRCKQISWEGKWSRFRNKTDNIPVISQGTLMTLASELEITIGLQSKDGLSICGAVYQPGKTRARKNVLEVGFIGLDFDLKEDRASQLEELRTWVNGTAMPGIMAVLHSTWSDGTNDQTRWRVLIPLAKPITSDDFDLIWPWLYQSCPMIDKTCSNPDRLFFTLRHNPESCRSAWAFLRAGQILDINFLPNRDGTSTSIGELRRIQAAIKQTEDRRLDEQRKQLEAARYRAREARSDKAVAAEMSFSKWLRRFVDGAIDSMAHNILAAQPGTRHDIILVEATGAGQILSGISREMSAGKIDPSDFADVTRTGIYAQLMSAVRQLGYDESDGERTIDDGMNYGEAAPRDFINSEISYNDWIAKTQKNRQRDAVLGGTIRQDKMLLSENKVAPPASSENMSDEGGGCSCGEEKDEAMGEPQPGSAYKPVSGSLPGWQTPAPRIEILVSGDDYEDISREILYTLHTYNDPPQLFVRGDSLLRIRQVPNPEPLSDTRYLAALDVFDGDKSSNRFRAFLSKRVKLNKEKHKKQQDGTWETYETVFEVPLELCSHILAMDEWKSFPPLEEIIRTPIVSPDGTIAIDNGYVPGLSAWIDLGGTQFDVPQEPTWDDVIKAKDLIINELFADFPFADEASLAHAVCLLLLPFVRHLIAGPTPLHMVAAPTPGSGKSLLVECACRISTGKMPEIMNAADSDEEWRKRLTATLIESPTMVCVDNMKGFIESQALCTALTSPTWGDRFLNHSKMVRVRINCVWAASANNPKMDGETIRRTIFINLDPKIEKPDMRTKFKHHPLRKWVMDSRKQLIEACLTMLRYWVKCGMPLDKTKDMGSYSEWTFLMGGIMEALKIPGFLGNRSSNETDPLLAEWMEFFPVWWEKHQNNPVTAVDIYKLAANEHHYNDPDADDAKEYLIMARGNNKGGAHGQKMRLGKALSDLRGRVLGGFVIRNGMGGATGFYLEKIEDEQE